MTGCADHVSSPPNKHSEKSIKSFFFCTSYASIRKCLQCPKQVSTCWNYHSVEIRGSTCFERYLNSVTHRFRFNRADIPELFTKV